MSWKIAVFVMALVSPATAIALADPVNGSVYTDPSTPIVVKAGQDFLIALPSNPTTGYSWTAKPNNADVAVYGSAFERPATVKGKTIVGAGGQQFFVLEAARIGTARVVFSYGRPWQKGVIPARIESFTIKITR